MQRKCRPIVCRRPRRRTIALLLGAAVACYILFSAEARLRPMILTMAEYECRQRAIQKMNAAVTDAMTAEPLLFDGLYQIERDPQGAVLAVTGDAADINQVKAHLTQQVAAALDQLREQTFYVPVGSLLGWQLLAGRGPSISFQAIPDSYVNSDVITTLDTAGINQTELRVFLVLQADMTAILGGYSAEVYVENQICIAQVLIVGQVPQTYVQ